MSFSVSIPIGPVEDFEKTLQAEVERYARVTSENSDSELLDESKESLAQAVKAATEIVKSGVVGTGKVAGAISGHANPGHKPRAGWSNDSLTIFLYNYEKSPSTRPPRPLSRHCRRSTGRPGWSCWRRRDGRRADGRTTTGRGWGVSITTPRDRSPTGH